MAKKLEKQADVRPLLTLIRNVKASKGNNGGGTLWWAELDGSHYIGTRHWFVRFQFVPTLVRAELLKLEITEPGFSYQRGSNSVKSAPDMKGLLKTLEDGKRIPLEDTRLINHSDDPIRLLTGGAAIHALSEEYYTAMDAAFPYQPLERRGDIIVFGETLLGMVLAVSLDNTMIYGDVTKHMKNPPYKRPQLAAQ